MKRPQRWTGFLECVRTHLHMPYRLIRSQKSSMTNAERLKSKYNETNINNAPQKFMRLKVSEWLLIRFTCSMK